VYWGRATSGRSGVSSVMPIRALIRPLLFAAVLAAFAAVPSALSAQVTAADSAAVLLATATAFEAEGERDVAAALYRHIVRRFPGTPAAESALARLDGRVTGGGETELRVWATSYGLWMGVAIPLALESEEPEAYGAGLLLGGPVGYLAAHRFARSRPVSPGQARAISWGGTWGAIQGAGWAIVFDLDDDRIEDRIWSMIAGGAIGTVGGVLASRSEITPGTATAATAGSVWGLWFGVATSVLADAGEDPTVAAAMVTGNIGLVAGALAGNRLPLSRGRTRLISLGGVIGGFAGLGSALIAEVDDEQSAIAFPLVGSIAGLIAGVALTRGEDVEDDPYGPDASNFGAGALVNWTEGALSLSTPLPTPTWDLAARAHGQSGLAWKIPLLNARF